MAILEDLSAALERLEHTWRRVYPGYVDALAGPLDSAGFADMHAWFGEVPDELLAWYGWHNGSTAVGNDFAFLGATRGLQFCSVAQAHQELLAQREIAVEMRGDGVPDVWGDRWFPLLLGMDGSTVAIDFTQTGGPHPIHWVGYDAQIRRDVAPSLIDVVTWWNEMHEAEVYVLGPAGWETRESEPLAHRYADLI